MTSVLPNDPKRLAAIIEQHAIRERNRMQFRICRWKIAHAYLNGARRFKWYGGDGRNVRSFTLDENGQMPLQLQDALSITNRVQSQLASMDVRPLVVNTQRSLMAMRERAGAQFLLNTAFDANAAESMKTIAAQIFTWLGCVGVHQHTINHPVMGLTTDYEVVHPREIYPFPSLDEDMTRQEGIMREYFVPADRVKQAYPNKVNARTLKEMEAYTRSIGESYEDRDNTDYFTGGANSVAPEDVSHTLIRLRHVWLYGPRGTCARHIVTSGRFLLEDTKFDAEQTYCPLVFKRYIETGEFHGAGVFDLVWGTARSLELMMETVVQNVKDADDLPIVLIPSGSVSKRKLQRGDGKDMHFAALDIDAKAIGLGGQRPFNPVTIAPHNLGDRPLRTLESLRESLDRINPVRDLTEAKGRIDSLPALQFIDEDVKQSIAGPVRNFALLFGDSHRSAAYSAARIAMFNSTPIPVHKLELSLAGLRINSREGTVSFIDNPLPDISRLTFSIREASPRSQALRKQEALGLLTTAPEVFTFERFILNTLEEGLDFAFWMEPERNAYETVVANLLRLYGDGKEPSEEPVFFTPAMARPDIQLLVVESFLSSSYMEVASAEVINEIQDYREALLQVSGLTLPQAVPDPIDSLLLQEQGGRTLPQR